MKPQIAVTTSEHSLIEKARALAEDLEIPFIFEFGKQKLESYQFLLIVTPDHLALQKTAKKVQQKIKPTFYIDFLSKQMRNRFKQKGLRSEFLARAIGIHPREKPFIVDATAGLGRDSFMLAALGFEVTMLEISPILYVLLKDALARTKCDELFSPIIERMHLIHADAITWLQDRLLKATHRPDVIYLDPMFPARKKSASVKKEMLMLQELLGTGNDHAELLLELALTCANERVVVKRPRLAAFLSDDQPNFSIKGKSSRFDVYLT